MSTEISMDEIRDEAARLIAKTAARSAENWEDTVFKALEGMWLDHAKGGPMPSLRGLRVKLGARTSRVGPVVKRLVQKGRVVASGKDSHVKYYPAELYARGQELAAKE